MRPSQVHQFEIVIECQLPRISLKENRKRQVRIRTTVVASPKLLQLHQQDPSCLMRHETTCVEGNLAFIEMGLQEPEGTYESQAFNVSCVSQISAGVSQPDRYQIGFEGLSAGYF